MNTAQTSKLRFSERLPLIPDRPVTAYLIAVALCIAALALRWELDAAFPPGYPYLTFFPAVILSSFLFGPRPGTLAAILCGLFAWYFFIPPRLSFRLDGQTITALLFYLGVVAVDIALVHLMQQANHRLRVAREEVRQLAEERGQMAQRTAVLFEELQHRLGNNLQMIGAILQLQLRGLEEPTARRAISDAAQRLQVIGNIQRQLYSPDGQRVPLVEYITKITDHLRQSTGRDGLDWQVTAQPGLVLRSETAVPVALILSEAVANALEHGLRDRATGRIEVSAHRQNGLVTIIVRDDGCGLPEGFDPEHGQSIGLRISRVLARQIQATYSLENESSGTVMRLSFPHE